MKHGDVTTFHMLSVIMEAVALLLGHVYGEMFPIAGEISM